MDLEHKIFQKIDTEDIHMHSRWFFYGKDISKFAIAIILISLSAVFCGMSIALGMHWARELSVSNFPYMLVALSLGTAFLAYVLFVHSFSFYKISFSLGILVLCLITFSFGYVIFAKGHAERFERTLQHFSIYQTLVPHSFQEHEKFEERD